MSAKARKIDVHHHCVPAEYVKRLASIGITESYGQPFPNWSPKKAIGITESYGQPFPNWSPKKALASMKKLGIETAILSISTPGVDFEDDEFSRDIARLCNEYMADVKESFPGRFGGFAAVPSPRVEWAIDELRYALDELNLDGVGLLTHYDGKYLGDRVFEDFFAELNNRNVVVFIHPTDPIGQYDPELEIANSLIEAPFETTRAVANLIHTGATDRFPKIKYILSHGGGTIPYLAWRIALSKYAGKEAKPSVLRMLYDFVIAGGPVSGLNILKNMYYDTALTASPYALRAMQEFVGSSKIVFGSDLPFAEKVAPIANKDLRNYTGFSAEDFEAIDYHNCLELFPHFRS
jgi:predicted TIM-barrel fold metal-dependent hydrolase